MLIWNCNTSFITRVTDPGVKRVRNTFGTTQVVNKTKKLF
jgi:hypothetical protein